LAAPAVLLGAPAPLAPPALAPATAGAPPLTVGTPALPLPPLLLLAPAWPAGASAAVEQASKAKHETAVEIRLLVFIVITSGVSAWRRPVSSKYPKHWRFEPYGAGDAAHA